MLIQVAVLGSIVWAVAAFVTQVTAARRGRRPDLSRPSGRPTAGLVYNFTAAMLPSHKESIARHPLEFAVGLLMHAGVVMALAGVVGLLVAPSRATQALSLGRPLLAAALAANLFLFIRRATSATLRTLNTPDDYLALLATGGLLALAVAGPVNAVLQSAFLAYGGLLFVYLPLGKLRHAVFFFVARGDYGRRLGYRGVYPPAATGTE